MHVQTIENVILCMYTHIPQQTNLQLYEFYNILENFINILSIMLSTQYLTFLFQFPTSLSPVLSSHVLCYIK